MTASLGRVRALVLRYVLLIGRDPSRVVDLVVWPFIDITIWGFLTMYVNQSGTALPNALAIFMGAAILWNVFLRASQDVSVSFLDDLWAHSLVTLFASPLTFAEFATALTLVGLVKVVLSLTLMSLVAWLLYAFNIFTLGWALLPFAANLILFGWALGMVALAIVLRFGGRWAILAWSIPFTMMPLCAVFYPESVLPPTVRAVARAIPATHVFEGMRGVVIDGHLAWGRVALATGENVVYLALATALVAWTFRVALTRGLLAKLR